MKKILSLVLVLVMVLGLSVTAFAEDLLTEVNFTLSEYVDENTAMTITVPTEEAANFSEISFEGFYCVSGDSAYSRDYNKGNGFIQAGFENWENYFTSELETPELDGSTLFAMFELTTVNKHMIKEGNTVVKNGGNVVPSLSDYIGFFDVDESHYKDEATYEAAYEAYISKYVSFTSCPTDTFWLFNETELTVFVKLFGSAPKSGTTEITAVKEEPEIKYTISIPTNVAEITNFGVYEVGQAKVTGVTGATEKTVISYTATTTDFKLSTDENKTMTASYYTEETAENAFPTTAVTVYEKEGDAASIPTMYVGISETDWNAAENGTYTATVTYNFSAEEAAVVTYMDWDSVNKKLVEKSVSEYEEVTDATTTLNAGKFYVVKGEDVNTGTLTVNGTAEQPTTLILADGAKLTVTGSNSAGINVASDKAVVITGQTNGTGVLIATGGEFGAGIGGDLEETGGNITINGGNITTTGGSDEVGSGAGIGAGACSEGGIVTINGGTITATGGNNAAGISGGSYGNGGTVTINGGTITATGKAAAGIGGGLNGGGGTYIINGGNITATGEDGAAGIGLGPNGSMFGNGTVNFGEGVNFTVMAGDAAPGESKTTTAYASDHSAAYVKITPAALEETYTVTFDTQGHTSIPPRTGVISGSTIFAPIVPLDAGYTFEGWYKEAACTNAWNFDTDTVTADTTLYAKWTTSSPK